MKLGSTAQRAEADMEWMIAFNDNANKVCHYPKHWTPSKIDSLIGINRILSGVKHQMMEWDIQQWVQKTDMWII
jgi:hypothetical protein